MYGHFTCSRLYYARLQESPVGDRSDIVDPVSDGIQAPRETRTRNSNEKLERETRTRTATETPSLTNQASFVLVASAIARPARVRGPLINLSAFDL